MLLPAANEHVKHLWRQDAAARVSLIISTQGNKVLNYSHYVEILHILAQLTDLLNILTIICLFLAGGA